MDRSAWEKILTRFQASARGYLVRNEVRRAREDFEDIAREIDGASSHVVWRETVIPTPHFTDIHQESPFLPPSSSVRGRDVSAGLQSPAAAAAAAPSSEETGDHHALLERIEAERDDSQMKGRTLSEDCLPTSSVRGDGEREGAMGDKDGGVLESTGNNTSVWSSLELDMNFGDHSHRGSRQYCLAQEVPCTPEALRLHRNTLTMELLWLQQAIDSRKKYLSLKDRLSIS